MSKILCGSKRVLKLQRKITSYYSFGKESCLQRTRPEKSGSSLLTTATSAIVCSESRVDCPVTWGQDIVALISHVPWWSLSSSREKGLSILFEVECLSVTLTMWPIHLIWLIQSSVPAILASPIASLITSNRCCKRWVLKRSGNTCMEPAKKTTTLQGPSVAAGDDLRYRFIYIRNGY